MEADFTRAIGLFFCMEQAVTILVNVHIAGWILSGSDLVNPTNLARGVGWKVKATK